MIVLDLEWNSGLYTRISLNEIIQIGAVKTAAAGGPILDTFNAYIRPTVHKRYSPAAEALPELDLCKASKLDFRAAIAAFAAWSAGETVYASWGEADLPILRQNLTYWGVSLPLPDTFFDLQEAFCLTVGATGRMALHYAVEYCRIPEVFDFHNSGNDALYTALVAEHIRPEALAACERVPGVSRKRAGKNRPAGLPKRRGQWQGPFADREELLNNRGCRLAVCPACGAKSRVSQWFYLREDICFAKFTCPDHGSFLLRLEVARRGEGQLWGCTEVQELTPENRVLWNRAKKAGTFPCRPRRDGDSRRKRWYIRRPAKKD